MKERTKHQRYANKKNEEMRALLQEVSMIRNCSILCCTLHQVHSTQPLSSSKMWAWRFEVFWKNTAHSSEEPNQWASRVEKKVVDPRNIILVYHFKLEAILFSSVRTSPAAFRGSVLTARKPFHLRKRSSSTERHHTTSGGTSHSRIRTPSPSGQV